MKLGVRGYFRRNGIKQKPKLLAPKDEQKLGDNFAYMNRLSDKAAEVFEESSLSVSAYAVSIALKEVQALLKEDVKKAEHYIERKLKDMNKIIDRFGDYDDE